MSQSKALRSEVVGLLKDCKVILPEEFHTQLNSVFNRFIEQRQKTNSKLTRLPEDRRPSVEKATSVEKLRLLYQHADKMTQLIICLALNCGLRPADMGRLTAEDFHSADQLTNEDRVPNGHAVLQFTSSKTHVFREYLLWPETLSLVQWSIERATTLGEALLLVTDTGKPMYDEQAMNPSTAIYRRIHRVVSQVVETVPDFENVTMSAIRRLGSKLADQYGDSAILSLYLGHVIRPASHQYMCLPFERLHFTLLEMRTHLGPIFEEPPVNRQT